MSVVGTCALCRTPEMVLVESHIVPSWAYKRIREPALRNPNPVKVTARGPVPTSHQLKEHLLCQPCDQKFGDVENWVSRIVYQDDDSAPILDMIERLEEVSSPSSPRLFPARPRSLDTARITYFAASVLWRAHLSVQVPRCFLGPKYAESFRRYLHSDADFPQKAAVVLFVLEDAPGQGSKVALSFSTPASQREGAYHSHWFAICGLQFHFAVGNVLPAWMVQCCLAHAPEKVLAIAHSDAFLDRVGPFLRAAHRKRPSVAVSQRRQDSA